MVTRREMLGSVLWTAAQSNLRIEANQDAAAAASLKAGVLRYVDSMRIPGGPYGRFRYAGSQRTPVIYSSCYAALSRHLIGALDNLKEQDRQEWVEYIQGFQGDDGLFRDPALACPLADSVDWWGWRHLAVHVYQALSALGTKPRRAPKWLEPMRDFRKRESWLKSLDWNDGVANTSNTVQNWCVGLQYARDSHGVDWADGAVKHILDYLDRTADAATGLWGPVRNTHYTEAIWLSNRVQAAYHFWLLYAYEARQPPYVAPAIVQVLRTQNPLGGFGWGCHNHRIPFKSSACEDIDSVDPLVRLGALTPAHRKEIRASLEKAKPWIRSNFNADGGAVFYRGGAFKYGHELMTSQAEESNMFATWFRLLSLAILDCNLIGRAIGWRFLDCPGYEFINPRAAHQL